MKNKEFHQPIYLPVPTVVPMNSVMALEASSPCSVIT